MSGDVVEAEAPAAAEPRPRSRRAWRWFNGAVLMLGVLTLAASSGPSEVVSAALLTIPAWLLLGLVWLGMAVAWLVRPGRLRDLLAAPAVVLLVVVLIAVSAPVRARFELSRTSFDELAASAPSGVGPTEDFGVHRRVGLFLISSGTAARGFDTPTTSPRCLLLDESPRFGGGGQFVFVPPGLDRRMCALGPSGVDLGGGWYTVGFDN